MIVVSQVSGMEVRSFLEELVIEIMKIIIPIMKLDNRKSIIVAESANPKLIVVRAQDLLTKKGADLSELFYKIKSSGGIHKFLDYNGKIILSFIMRDNLLRKTGVPIWSDLLDGLKPDYFMTPDCETYDNEYDYSKKQIKKCLVETIELMRLFPEIKPIGLVKGCDRNQVLIHYRILKNLGMKIFVLHSGDFFRHGDNGKIQRLKAYASLIKEKDNILLLSGFGCQKRLEEFSFVDGFITYSHMVNAQHNVVFEGRKRVKNTRMTYIEQCKHNLKMMVLNLKDSFKQTKLWEFEVRWVAELESQDQIIQK